MILRERAIAVTDNCPCLSEHYAYPCIYLFHFLGLFTQENEIYQTVVNAGKTGSTAYLDIGCCSKFFTYP